MRHFPYGKIKGFQERGYTEDLGPLLRSDSVQVVEGVLAALPALDDAEAALGRLLDHAGTDRAQVTCER